MLQKSVRSAALFFVVLLSIGCSRNGDVENPDGGIVVTTLEAIHVGFRVSTRRVLHR